MKASDNVILFLKNMNASYPVGKIEKTNKKWEPFEFQLDQTPHIYL